MSLFLYKSEIAKVLCAGVHITPFIISPGSNDLMAGGPVALKYSVQ